MKTILLLKNKTLLLLCFVLIGISATAQNALQATGGSGIYKKNIWWLNFSGVTLSAGQTLTRNFTVNGIIVTVTIDNVSFSATPANQTLIGYNSGNFLGNGIDNLYNIGGSENANTLTYSLRNNITGGGNGATSNFRIRAYATLNGQAMDLGLIFANGESDGFINGVLGNEYNQVTTNGSAWQLLEKAVTSSIGNANRSIIYSNNNLTTRTSMSANAESGPSNVALMYTRLDNTSSSNRLSGNVTMFSGGRGAIALGLVVNEDLSDAPSSYGNPAHEFLATVIGGENPNPVPTGSTTNTAYLSSGPNAGTPVINAGTLSSPTSPRIGAIAGDGDAAVASIHNAAANTDDNSDSDDEDGVGTIPFLTTAHKNYSITNIMVTTAITPAYLSGWIDFNRNGIFESSEIATATINTTGTTSQTLNWNFSSVTGSAGTSYLRLRVSNTDPSFNVDDIATSIDERSTSTLSGGEVEDHQIQINRLDISGHVYEDDNLLDNLINGLVTLLSGSLNANLISVADNKVVQTSSISLLFGYYEFNNVAPGNYKVQVSKFQGIPGSQAPVTALPVGWRNSGEQIGNVPGAGMDALTDGELTLSVLTTSLTEVNFGITQNLSTLPVELTSFTAQLNDEVVDLKWTTSSEKNVSHFAVEKSLDGKNYTDIGIVFAIGNSAETLNYKFTDKNINGNQAGIIYYRLRSVDIDKTYELSAVRMITIGNQNKKLVTIMAYPNPVSNELRITIPANWQGKKVTYELLGNNGQASRRNVVASANQTESINVAGIPPGFYVARVICNDESAQQKVIKQ